MAKKKKESEEKNPLEAFSLSENLREFLMFQREENMLDSTIDVMFSLIKFTNKKKGADYKTIEAAVRETLSNWINFRPVNKNEQINVEELAMIEANEKVIPGVSREYWYRRLHGGSVLAELGSVYDEEKKKDIVRFLGGIFFQITKGNPKNFGELTNNRKFDHDPEIGDTVNFYSVSTEESYREYKFHLGSELVFHAAKHVVEKYPNVKTFQTFSPFTIEKYAIRFLDGKHGTIVPLNEFIDLFTLKEKTAFVQSVFNIINKSRQTKLKKTGNVFSYAMGFVKGNLDYAYAVVSRLKGREKLFREALSHAIKMYSSKKNSDELRDMYFSEPEIRRIIRRVYEFLTPYYLQERDEKGRYLNPVQNFHMKNGSIPGDVMIFAATEMDRKPIWGYTAGGLCCIRYVYPGNEEERIKNSENYGRELKKFRKKNKENVK